MPAERRASNRITNRPCRYDTIDYRVPNSAQLECLNNNYINMPCRVARFSARRRRKAARGGETTNSPTLDSQIAELSVSRLLRAAGVSLAFHTAARSESRARPDDGSHRKDDGARAVGSSSPSVCEASAGCVSAAQPGAAPPAPAASPRT